MFLSYMFLFKVHVSLKNFVLKKCSFTSDDKRIYAIDQCFILFLFRRSRREEEKRDIFFKLHVAF